MAKENIAIAFSGGGVRAVAFHAGVTQWLAESGQLENIRFISSVSGGSLFTGLVFHYGEYRWPRRQEYLENVFPRIREVLTQTSLQKAMLLNLFFKPQNWRYFRSRAMIFSGTLSSYWGITRSLKALPESPVWSINGTTGENGKRCRVKARTFGDYEIGYAELDHFKLSDAIAISSALPFGMGPVVLHTDRYRWKKRKSWDSDEYIENYRPPYRKLNLYDGGLYDNLGIEPIFDVGRKKIKSYENLSLNKILVSDSSAPLHHCQIPSRYSFSRLVRFSDIMMDQVRLLRLRSLLHFFEENPSGGRYYGLGTNLQSLLEQLPSSHPERDASRWLNDRQTEALKQYPSTIARMKEEDFDLLARSGYETAKLYALLESVTARNG